MHSQPRNPRPFSKLIRLASAVENHLRGAMRYELTGKPNRAAYHRSMAHDLAETAMNIARLHAGFLPLQSPSRAINFGALEPSNLRLPDADAARPANEPKQA